MSAPAVTSGSTRRWSAGRGPVRGLRYLAAVLAAVTTGLYAVIATGVATVLEGPADQVAATQTHRPRTGARPAAGLGPAELCIGGSVTNERAGVHLKTHLPGIELRPYAPGRRGRLSAAVGAGPRRSRPR